MNQLQLQLDISHWVVNLAFWCALAFPVVTRFYWPWLDEWWGRNIVTLELLIAFALLGSVLRIDLGVNFVYDMWFGWLTIASVGLIPLVIIQRAVLIWRAQKKGAEEQLAKRTRIDDLDLDP